LVARSEVVKERLAALRATIERLRTLRQQARSGDPIAEWAIERGLQIAAQAVFDVGNHVLSGGFGERPSEYGQVAPQLARHGVIAPDLEARLRGLAGFRNLLVHDYARVDAARVFQLLQDRLEDLGAFADAVERWLQGQEAGPP
jgi:uncharacterized protein YutE (UPF0331/DUF86 family)